MALEERKLSRRREGKIATRLHPVMPDRTPCIYCHKVGFVRRERMIAHGKATTIFYCGACNKSWEVVEPDDAAAKLRRGDPSAS